MISSKYFKAAFPTEVREKHTHTALIPRDQNQMHIYQTLTTLLQGIDMIVYLLYIFVF